MLNLKKYEKEERLYSEETEMLIVFQRTMNVQQIGNMALFFKKFVQYFNPILSGI